MKAVTLLDYEAKAGSAVARMLLDYGRVMPVDGELDSDFTKGELGECYRNAWTLYWELERQGWQYMEGRATNSAVLGIPFAHAWLVTPEGLVVDPTWECGLDYYGVVIPRDVAAEVMAVTETYGVLDALWVYGAKNGRGEAEKILARIAEAQP